MKKYLFLCTPEKEEKSYSLLVNANNKDEAFKKGWTFLVNKKFISAKGVKYKTKFKWSNDENVFHVLENRKKNRLANPPNYEIN